MEREENSELAAGGAELGAVEEATNLVCEASADVFERLGMRRVLGRLWAVLYVSPRPIDADELRGTLGVSAGTLSSALNDLIGTGLVVRETAPGERRFYYRAEKEMWGLVTRMFKERERSRLSSSVEKLKQAESLLEEAAKDGDGEEEILHRLQYIQHLIGLGGFVLDILDAFMERTKVEVKAAQKWLSVSGRLGGEPLSRLRKRINKVRKEK